MDKISFRHESNFGHEELTFIRNDFDESVSIIIDSGSVNTESGYEYESSSISLSKEELLKLKEYILNLPI